MEESEQDGVGVTAKQVQRWPFVTPSSPLKVGGGVGEEEQIGV